MNAFFFFFAGGLMYAFFIFFQIAFLYMPDSYSDQTLLFP